MKSDPSPRERVNIALSHRRPDRIPVDFLAVPEIWDLLAARLGIEKPLLDESRYFDPAWEEILRRLEVDCRVISYDQFCAPPESAFAAGGPYGMVEGAEPIDARPHVALGRQGRHRYRDLRPPLQGSSKRARQLRGKHAGAGCRQVARGCPGASLARPGLVGFRSGQVGDPRHEPRSAPPYPLPHGRGLRIGLAAAGHGEFSH